MTEHLVVQNDEDTSLRRSSSYQQLEQHKLVNWDQVEAFAVNLSRVSLALVDGDQSGELQKLQLEGMKQVAQVPKNWEINIMQMVQENLGVVQVLKFHLPLLRTMF